MGKADDMRRLREAQYGGPAAEAEAPAADGTIGKCATCGKALAIQRGVVAQHQKGLGKFCPGSRKPPA